MPLAAPPRELRISFAETEGIDDYDKNVQIADLNAFNAALAVMRWKKMRGFYFDPKHGRLRGLECF